MQQMEEKYKEELEERKKNMSEPKCEECKKQQRLLLRREILTKEETLEGFQQVTDEDWEDQILPKVRVQQGNVWDALAENALILPCDKKFETKARTVGRAIDKFGGKSGLKYQRRQKGEVAQMTHSLSFPDEEGNDTHMVRNIYYPIVSDGDNSEEIEDKNIFQALKALKAYVMRHGKTKMAIPEMEGVVGARVIRMLEFLFVTAGIEITVYRPNEDQHKGIGNKGKVREPRESTVTGDTRIKRRQEALLIKMEGKPIYTDLHRFT